MSDMMYDPLEIKLMEAVNKKKISFDEIETILKQLLEKEAYVTILSKSGKVYDDVLLELGLFWPGIKISRTSEHNRQINEIKRTRLIAIIKMIENNADLSLIKAYIVQNKPILSDLTFLLTLSVNKTPSNLDEINLLIDKGADVNGVGVSGQRPIYVAVRKGNLDSLRLLRQRGANLQLLDLEDKTLIFAALRNQQASLIPALVNEFACDINGRDYEGRTPLHMVVIDGHKDGVQVAQYLIDNGADITAKNAFGETPLETAVSNTRGGEPLLGSRFIPDAMKREVIKNRATLAELLRIALRERERINRIFSAIERQKGVDILLSNLDIQDKDISLLIQSLKKMSSVFTINLSNNPLTTTAVQILIDYLESETLVCQLILEGTRVDLEALAEFSKRISPDRCLERFLAGYNAIEKLDVLTNLIKLGANVKQVNNEGWFIVHCASYYGHLATMRLLLEVGVNIGLAIEVDRKTALHIATENGHIELVIYLLEIALQQADPIDITGHTPLSLAVQRGYALIVEVLLSHGADPNHKVNNEYILELAVKNRHAKITTKLLRRGARLNENIWRSLAEDDHETKGALKERLNQEKMLFLAVQQGDQAKVENLLEAGVDINCRGENGLSVLQWCLRAKNWKLSAWFLYKGADYKMISEIQELSTIEKQALTVHGARLYERDPKSSIYFLLSKTQYVSKHIATDFDIALMYEELFGRNEGDVVYIQNTRPILQVIEYCSNLTILFDPQKEDTKRADLDAKEGTKGSYSPPDHVIRIAGRSGSYEDVRGTVAHEICHMACDLVWNNQRNPYTARTPEEVRFTDIYSIIEQEYLDTKTRKNLDPIIQAVFEGYEQIKHNRELIVRVPQIIAVHGMPYAQILCGKSTGFSLLFNYYQEVVLPNFVEFIKKSDPTHWPLSLQSEKDWDSFALYNTKKHEQTADEAAVKIQSVWKGAITRQTYHRIQFIEAYINRLTALLSTLGAVETEAVLMRELNPKFAEIKDNFRSLDARLLFAFKTSKIMADKLKSTNSEVSTLITKFKLK